MARLSAQVVDFSADRLPDPVSLVLERGQREASVPVTHEADSAAGPDRALVVTEGEHVPN